MTVSSFRAILNDLEGLNGTFDRLSKAEPGDYLQTFGEKRILIDARKPSFSASLWYPKNSYWAAHAHETMKRLECYAYLLSNKIHNCVRYGVLSGAEFVFISPQITDLSAKVQASKRSFAYMQGSFEGKDRELFGEASERLFTTYEKMIVIWESHIKVYFKPETDLSDFDVMAPLEDKSLALFLPILKRGDFSELEKFLRNEMGFEIGEEHSLDFLHTLQGVLIKMQLEGINFSKHPHIVNLLDQLAITIEAGLCLLKLRNQTPTSMVIFDEYWSLIQHHLSALLPDRILKGTNCRGATVAKKVDPQWVESFIKAINHNNLEVYRYVLDSFTFKEALKSFLLNKLVQLDEVNGGLVTLLATLNVIDFDLAKFDQETGALSQFAKAIEDKIEVLASGEVSSINKGLFLLRCYFQIKISLNEQFLATREAVKLMSFWGKKLMLLPDLGVSLERIRKKIEKTNQGVTQELDHLISQNQDLLMFIKSDPILYPEVTERMETLYPEEAAKRKEAIRERKDLIDSFVLSVEMVNRTLASWRDNFKCMGLLSAAGLEFRIGELRDVTGYISENFYVLMQEIRLRMADIRRHKESGLNKTLDAFFDLRSLEEGFTPEAFLNRTRQSVLKSLEQHVFNYMHFIYASLVQDQTNRHEIEQDLNTGDLEAMTAYAELCIRQKNELRNNQRELVDIISKWYQLDFNFEQERAKASLVN
jgi:hypothetical protein